MDEIAQHGIEKVQILSPFKSRGDTCVKNLNDRLREIINPPSPKTTEMAVNDVARDLLKEIRGQDE